MGQMAELLSFLCYWLYESSVPREVAQVHAETRYKDVARMCMAAEKSPDLQLANWGPGRAHVSVHPKAGEDTWGPCSVPSGRRGPLTGGGTALCSSGPSAAWMRPPRRGAVWFPPHPHSSGTLAQRHPPQHGARPYIWASVAQPSRHIKLTITLVFAVTRKKEKGKNLPRSRKTR